MDNSFEQFNDDLLDEMEKGELINYGNFYEKEKYEESSTLKKKIRETSKRIITMTTGLTRQKSDVSLKSDTSNESSQSLYEISPYTLEEGETDNHFNWGILDSDETKTDDSKLNEFYNDYNKNRQLNLLTCHQTPPPQHKQTQSSDNYIYNFNNKSRMRAKYHSFNQINSN